MSFADLLNRFEHPADVHRPTPLWWWSGDKVTAERLLWQVDRFHEGGVNALVVINLAPAGPTYGSPADDPAWFSQEWWELFETVCAHMSDKGMQLWFYDQIGFSGANLQGQITQDHPWAAGQRLVRHQVSPAQGRVAAPDGQQLIACFADGQLIDLGEAGELPWSVPTPATLDLICAAPTAFDYLNPAACDLLLDRVHREFERRLPQYLGSVIAGSFQDELPSTNSWTPGFLTEFRARRGYDLREHLLDLFQGQDSAALQARADYYAVRSALTEEALFIPLYRWHEDHGLLHGADQSNPARAAFPIQSTQMYTDYFRTHRWVNAVGSDHEGDSHAHASLARLHGHNQVWLEAFHSSGWGGTLEETWDWLLPFLRAGATLYNPHASYYATVGGWFEWAPPSTDWRQPYWRQYPAFARAVARTASVLGWGDFSAQVAVLHPTSTVQAEVPLGTGVRHFTDMTDGPALGPELSHTDQSQRDYLALCGNTNWFRPKPSALDQAGISFDVIDDVSIQRAELDEGTLAVAAQSYRTVVLPGCRVLEAATASALLSLLNAGGSVICLGDVPAFIASQEDRTAATELANHPGLLRASSPEHVVELIGRGHDLAFSDVPLHVRHCGAMGAALVPAQGSMVSTWASDEVHPMSQHDLSFDRTHHARERTVSIRGQVTRAEWWSPSTGERCLLPIQREGDRSTVVAPLAGAPAGLLVWTTAEDDREWGPEPAAPLTTHGAVQDLTRGWTTELTTTMDNRWADFGPAGADLDLVQVWTVHHDGQPATATHGEQAAVACLPRDRAAALDPEHCRRVLAEDLDLTADSGFEAVSWSPSHGPRHHGRNQLGNKGEIPADFIPVPNPGPAQVGVVRVVIDAEHSGAADLVVGTSAPIQVWWDGSALQTEDTGHARRHRVDVTPGAHVLEYHLGQSTHPGAKPGSPVGTWFTLASPGSFGPRPEFMQATHPDPGLLDQARLTFATTVTVPASASSALLTLGCVSSATIAVDGQLQAVQAKVEYYEGGTPSPNYFRFDLTQALGPGSHQLAVTVDTDDPADLLFADLVIRCQDGSILAVPSGAGWSVGGHTRTSPSAAVTTTWSTLETAHSVRRPHPLSRAAWLRGEPELGTSPLPISCRVHGRRRPTTVTALLPAGSTQLSVLTDSVVELTVAGRRLTAGEGPIMLDPPTAQPTLLTLHSPAGPAQGPSVLTGPLLVRTQAVAAPLGSWQDLGLGSWSGGVSYQREISLDQDAVLDLGDLRGSVEVWLAGVLVGEAFCAPFRFMLPSTQGDTATLQVVVHNTLAPHFGASTSTWYAFDDQQLSGLFGPVTLTTLDADGSTAIQSSAPTQPTSTR